MNINPSNFFILSIYDQESCNNIYLLGPENLSQVDFIKLTDELHNKAIQLLIQKEYLNKEIDDYYPEMITPSLVNEKISKILCEDYEFFIISNIKKSSYYDHLSFHNLEFFPVSYEEDFKMLDEETKNKLIQYSIWYNEKIKQYELIYE